jgi:hypothetical protein
MLNIPAEIRNLFKMDGIRKNIRIHFPNGEREDITNDNIIKDSFRFSERLCSRDSLKFGLCEANSLEVECFDVANVKGATIEASVELLLDEPITITETRKDLVYDNITVNFGTSFIIEFDEKTSGTLSWDFLDCEFQDTRNYIRITTDNDTDPDDVVYAGSNFAEFHFDDVKRIVIESYLTTTTDYDINIGPVRFNHDSPTVQKVIEDKYVVPYGTFIIDSCEKQSELQTRKIIA